MILNNYEISTFFLFCFMIVFLFYVLQTLLFVIYHYKPKLIDKKLNEKLDIDFDNKIKTNNEIPFILRDIIIFILLIPFIIIFIIIIFDYKLIVKILKKTIKPLLFHLVLSTTSMALFYFIIFYSSNYLVIEFK